MQHFHPTRLAALFAPALFSLSALAQTTATTPATAPASAAQAKAALADFYRLMYDADPKALDLLVFTNLQSEKAARLTAQFALAQQRVRLAAQRAFADAAGSLSIGVSDKDRQQFEKDLQQAAVTVQGATATIRLPSGDTFIVVQKSGPAGAAAGGGGWKLDFDKTQANMGPLPKDADLPALTAQTESLNTLAADLDTDARAPDPATRRFKSINDLKLRLQQLPATPSIEPAR